MEIKVKILDIGKPGVNGHVYPASAVKAAFAKYGKVVEDGKAMVFRRVSGGTEPPPLADAYGAVTRAFVMGDEVFITVTPMDFSWCEGITARLEAGTARVATVGCATLDGNVVQDDFELAYLVTVPGDLHASA